MDGSGEKPGMMGLEGDIVVVSDLFCASLTFSRWQLVSAAELILMFPHIMGECMLVISGWAECIYPPNRVTLY